ncbi:hypothetical protein F4556_002890 [Kitasatospora gansuensis]|uniref:DUF1565 domain-containing protein n=1 Tax=Kitasatospora gansuensis TaxID=258050 RepID=A0A7W7WI28_9ACTN|nr:right-handed parallel beta-helix repeat-containing protein [Kitasatospora gansuensis]MBB4947355.1 hypothetical protein [Kitasatospora gansuensis]
MGAGIGRFLRRTVIRTRVGALSAAVLLGALALPAFGPGGAAAAPLNIYVNNAVDAHCSDAGSGLQSQPFCTVQAAADVVLPGQTVNVAQGEYRESVKLTRSGNQGAPITFAGPGGHWTPNFVNVGSAGSTAGFSVVGAQHVWIRGLSFSGSQFGLLVENSGDVRVTDGGVVGGSTAAVRVTGADSQKVTIGRFTLLNAPGVGMVVDGGAKGTTLTTNLVNSGSATAVSVVDSPGTVVVSNSLYAGCRVGLELAGKSPDAVLMNNVVAAESMSDGNCGSQTPQVKISAESRSGLRADYNVVSAVGGRPAYQWGSESYSSQATFATETNQGVHDSFDSPVIPYQGDRHLGPLPTVDSADESAPGMLGVDVAGQGPVDDPVKANSGTGKGFRDRGATEYLNVGTAYTPTGPTRILDTRDEGENGRLTSMRRLKVTGSNGVPTFVTKAVTMNVTVTATSSAGYLSTSYGSSSVLNWSAAGQTVANLVTVPVDVDGMVTFYLGGSAVDVIADLAGYYSGSGSIFTATDPSRSLDTREAIGVPGHTPVAPGGTVELQVAGHNGVPTTGATAVTMNVTVTEPTGGGYLTVYPHGKDRPVISSLNWTPGRTIANLVTVPVVDGKVSFYNGSGGTVHVIADVAGYYGASGHDVYRVMQPNRLLDTRTNTQDGCMKNRQAAVVTPGQTIELGVCWQDITSATLNVTVTEPTAAGFLTVYPTGSPRPVASNLNWTAGQTIPNQVVVPVRNQKVSFYNGSGGTVHLVVDMFGYQSY